MKFREANKKDLNGIIQILIESYISLEGSKELAKKEYKTELNYGHHFFIAVEKKEVIGLIAWFYHGLKKHCLIEIDRFAVKSEYRRKGVGRKLFQKLIENLNKYFSKYGGVRKVFLVTRKKNKRALIFYKKLGFKKVGELKNHFYKKVDYAILEIYPKLIFE